MFNRCYHCGHYAVRLSKAGGLCPEGLGILNQIGMAMRRGTLDYQRQSDGYATMSQRFANELLIVVPVLDLDLDLDLDTDLKTPVARGRRRS